MKQNPDHLCTSIALYDWEGDLDVRDFHAIALSFFELSSVAPNDACITRSNKEIAGSPEKIAKLLAAETQSAQTELCLYHLPPKAKEFMVDWDVMAESMYAQGSKDIFLGCDWTLANVDLKLCLPLFHAFARHIKLRYGIGFHRTFRLGPAPYALGIITGLDYSDKEADRIGSWFKEQMNRNRHLQGYLRDVYPLNVLSAPHLAQPVAGVPLGQWIAASPERGTLTSLPNDAWLWLVEEQHIDIVRSELIAAGLLIAYLQSD